MLVVSRKYLLKKILITERKQCYTETGMLCINMINGKIKTIVTTVTVLLLFSGCFVADNEFIQEAVTGFTVFKNGVEVPFGPDGIPPAFEIMEGKTAVLGTKLSPVGVRGGVHWQTSRDIVELGSFSGTEILLYARYGGDTIIQISTANIFNEVPVFGEVGITVIPTSYFKWNWEINGWEDMPAFSSARIGRYHLNFVRTGETPVIADKRRGGIVLEGPGILIIGSTMAIPTNSPFHDDPAHDVAAELNFTVAPDNRFLPPEYIGISIDYEILEAASPRRGLRIQVNNNTLERGMASALDNWLVAELTGESPLCGTIRGVFNTTAAQLDPDLPEGKRLGIPGDNDGAKINSVLRSSFVALSLPEGKVLIRNIQIYNVYNDLREDI